MARSRVKGDSRLRKQMRFMPEAVTTALKDEIRRSADELGAEIRERAPKDQGDMAEALTVQISRDGLGAAIGYSPNRSGFKRMWRRGGFTALFQEFGTRHHAAQPFISPAYKAKLLGILNRIDKAVDKALYAASKHGLSGGDE